MFPSMFLCRSCILGIQAFDFVMRDIFLGSVLGLFTSCVVLGYGSFRPRGWLILGNQSLASASVL